MNFNKVQEVAAKVISHIVRVHSYMRTHQRYALLVFLGSLFVTTTIQHLIYSGTLFSNLELDALEWVSPLIIVVLWAFLLATKGTTLPAILGRYFGTLYLPFAFLAPNLFQGLRSMGIVVGSVILLVGLACAWFYLSELGSTGGWSSGGGGGSSKSVCPIRRSRKAGSSTRIRG
jgi:hypothetical protein